MRLLRILVNPGVGLKVLVAWVGRPARGPKRMAELTWTGTWEAAFHGAWERGVSIRMDTVSDGVDPFRGCRMQDADPVCGFFEA
jgi:hypothetical protein